MRQLRTGKRRCPVCQHPMKRLDEKQDDAYLNSGQRVEEHVGSVDYDVWLCLHCGQREILPYDKAFTRYQLCPSCRSRTMTQTADRILLAPTPLSAGEGERVYTCSHCHYQLRKPYIIPMIILPPRGGGRPGGFGGFGGGGFGGGSFGGGMSGGGGATGSWR
jgi:uncharacterized protein